MICNKCGKENASESKFCVYCGNEVQEPQAEPQQQFQGQQAPINPMIRQKVEEDKKNRKIKSVKTLVKFSSIMWLIAGIACLIFSLTAFTDIVINSEKIFSIKTVDDKLEMNRNYSAVVFMISQFFMGILGLFIYNSRRKHKTLGIFNNSVISAILLFVQIMISVNCASCFTGDVFPFYRALSDSIYIIYFLILALQIIAVLTDIAIEIIVKVSKLVRNMYNERLSKSIVCITAILGFSVFVLSAFGSMYINDRTQYNSERDAVISKVKYGYLDGYPGKTVSRLLRELENDDDNFSYYDSWIYAECDPMYYSSKYGVGNKNIRYVSTYFDYLDSRSDIYEYTKLIFRLDTPNNKVSLYQVFVNGECVDDIQNWIDITFDSAKREKYRKNQQAGERYLKSEVDVNPNTVLYSQPSYNKDSNYTYRWSHKEKVLDYKIINGTLWLKLEGSSDGKIENFWITQYVK